MSSLSSEVTVIRPSIKILLAETTDGIGTLLRKTTLIDFSVILALSLFPLKEPFLDEMGNVSGLHVTEDLDDVGMTSVRHNFDLMGNVSGLHVTEDLDDVGMTSVRHNLDLNACDTLVARPPRRTLLA